MDDFILCSVDRTIWIIWKTFSHSNKLFPLRWTYLGKGKVISFNLARILESLAKFSKTYSILANENEEIFSLFAIVFLLKLKKPHYNIGTAACNLCLSIPETYL